MLLVQLSDLHIGGTYFQQEIFDTIVNEVKNKLKPDVILITGDLTDEGLVSQFRRASMEIKKLTEVCPKVIILPGNPVIRVTCFSRNSFHPVLSLHLESTDLIVRCS